MSGNNGCGGSTNSQISSEKQNTTIKLIDRTDSDSSKEGSKTSNAVSKELVAPLENESKEMASSLGKDKTDADTADLDEKLVTFLPLL
ncbi:hypothetical protein MMC07_003403 [Pseudocyphellaria aurata]|nr:hypothetical protein [Pseudocyphellaria aurata]